MREKYRTRDKKRRALFESWKENIRSTVRTNSSSWNSRDHGRSAWIVSAEKRRRRESNSRQGRSPCPLSIREHAPSYPSSISSLFFPTLERVARNISSTTLLHPHLRPSLRPSPVPVISLSHPPLLFSLAFLSLRVFNRVPPLPLFLHLLSSLHRPPWRLHLLPSSSSSQFRSRGRTIFSRYASPNIPTRHTSNEPAPEHRRRDAAAAAVGCCCCCCCCSAR